MMLIKRQAAKTEENSREGRGRKQEEMGGKKDKNKVGLEIKSQKVKSGGRDEEL